MSGALFIALGVIGGGLLFAYLRERSRRIKAETAATAAHRKLVRVRIQGRAIVPDFAWPASDYPDELAETLQHC